MASLSSLLSRNLLPAKFRARPSALVCTITLLAKCNINPDSCKYIFRVIRRIHCSSLLYIEVYDGWMRSMIRRPKTA